MLTNVKQPRIQNFQTQQRCQNNNSKIDHYVVIKIKSKNLASLLTVKNYKM